MELVVIVILAFVMLVANVKIKVDGFLDFSFYKTKYFRLHLFDEVSTGRPD